MCGKEQNGASGSENLAHEVKLSEWVKHQFKYYWNGDFLPGRQNWGSYLGCSTGNAEPESLQERLSSTLYIMRR